MYIHTSIIYIYQLYVDIYIYQHYLEVKASLGMDFSQNPCRCQQFHVNSSVHMWQRSQCFLNFAHGIKYDIII